MKAIRDIKSIFIKTFRRSGSGNCMIARSPVSVLIISVIVLLVGIIS
ncbi:MAG: hypothetical protein K8S14_07125 [Actinomycetia bacterium]|nr:hypothetical protein [Actinomycetes bacterium]